MTIPMSLAAAALVIAGGIYLARRVQRGPIDYLTPLLAVYAIHTVTRGIALIYLPEWLQLNDQVAAAPEPAIADALTLTAIALCPLIACYLIAFALVRPGSTTARELVPLSTGLGIAFIVVGVACRALLRLASAENLPLPDWAYTPIETFGWTALVGVFTIAFNCGRSPHGERRRTDAWIVAAGTLAILLVDARLTTSREATLQPLMAGLLGVMMGAGASMLRMIVAAVVIASPLFIWIGAMKSYSGLRLGDGAPGYLEAMSAVRQHSEFSWPQWVVSGIQERFHGLDSLIVTRALVPAFRPYEPGSVWTQVLVSAFVPRALYPDKQVGWAQRFAMEFWGVAPETEGRAAAVGISHLGTLYVYGGTTSCLTGMAVLGGGLGVLAAFLQRRRTVLGTAVFVLTVLTICQVDRDLEVVLGGVLKQLAVFAIVPVAAPLFTVTARRAGAASRSPEPHAAFPSH